MRNILFTLWMLLFYPAVGLGDYLESLANPNPHHDPLEAAIYFGMMFVIWLVTGYLLYERKSTVPVTPSNDDSDSHDKARLRK